MAQRSGALRPIWFCWAVEMKPAFSRIRTGDQVIITAHDDFYAFVDGWIGRVTGWQAGHAEVKCQQPDGEKVLYVPPEQLALNIGGRP